MNPQARPVAGGLRPHHLLPRPVLGLGWATQDLISWCKRISSEANSRAAIFITTTGLATFKSDKSNDRAQELFASILRTNASPGIRIGYEVEAEDHNSSRLLGLYDGLRFIFEGLQTHRYQWSEHGFIG